MKKVFFILLIVLLSIASQGQSNFPLKISENKRYFVTQQNKPFLYHADTGWKIFSKLTTKEAVEYFSFRKSQGFNTIQTIIVMSPEDENQYGQKAFLGAVDFTRPNEAYFDHVAEVIAKADSMGLLIVMAQPWLGCCEEGFGGRIDKPFLKNGPEKSKALGQYFGKKFARFNNLFWIMGGDSDPKNDRESLFALIDGIYTTAPACQLMTYHGSAPHSSTDLFQYSPWLGFSFIYTYWREKPNEWVRPELTPHVYEAALREWSKTDRMPFVLGESQYEGNGRIVNDMGNPQIIRRQAYWTMLYGGAGEAYGSELYCFPENWREIMRYPGAFQMGYFIKFFERIPWWTLVPDIDHQAVVSGYGDWAKPNYVTTAVSGDRKLMVSYIPQIQAVYVDFNFLSGNSFKCSWYNPVTGETEKVFTVNSKTVQRISPEYGEDWVLMVQGE